MTKIDDYLARWDRETVTGMKGLDRIGVLELSNDSYQFDLLGLWKSDEGFFLGTDSGCSCPTPWENVTRDDLTGPLTAEQAFEEATSLIDAARAREYSAGPDRDETAEFLRNLPLD